MKNDIRIIQEVRNPEGDKEALDHWQRESTLLEEAGVHAELAKHINIQRNQIFLNVGMGLAPLERQLARRKTGAHFISTEINDETIKEARSLLGHAGVRSHIIRDRIGSKTILDRDSMTQGNLFTAEWNDLQDYVLILPGDFRQNQQELETVMNGQADWSCVSLTGSSRKLVLEDIPEFEDIEFFGKVMHVQLHAGQTNVDALASATQLTKPGGTLIRLVRGMPPPDLPMEEYLESHDEFSERTLGRFWKTQKKWDVLPVDVADIYERIRIDSLKPKILTYQLMTRNKNPYDHAYFDSVAPDEFHYWL